MAGMRHFWLRTMRMCMVSISVGMQDFWPW